MDELILILDQFKTVLISGVIGALVAYIIATPSKLKERERLERERLDKIESMLDLIIEANKISYRAEIAEEYDRLMKQGYATELEKRSVQERYEMYKKLGGNSYVTELLGQIMELPNFKEFT